ncbi:hypothetical protein NVP1262O_30 [Vibrio phage 1.262.O._10N.286.51.A9]|nr:hypothetical protein NVP1262O_30 [Vibrio phage 1.262.O._10N.286.51.A9]
MSKQKHMVERNIDVSVSAYKREQYEAQRQGRDIGTYPQWKNTQLKQQKFLDDMKAELAKKEEEKLLAEKPKPVKKPRKPRKKKESNDE